MTTPAIRAASLDDLAAVSALFDSYRQFYEQESNPALAAQFIRQRIANRESVILVAENEGREIIGFCQLYPSFCSVQAAPIYVLYDLFVAPTARKGGAGKALLMAAHSHAASQGMARLDLTTAKTNLPAQALYESLGWVRDEVFYAYNLAVN
ncbi:GNAT family N-acetyltransferase [Paraherbaspirillum soli]|uniref:GNAT family N-acetyltransferase n=1 Tax=Paraherbaspirillum soli TaxID=631222 RepID=A0ABW0M947_9BURK